MSSFRYGSYKGGSSARGNSHWHDIATELRPVAADEPRHVAKDSEQVAWLPAWLSSMSSDDGKSVLRPLMVGVLTILCSMNMVSLAASKRAVGQFKFEYVTVTLLQECCKLCIAFVGLQLEIAYCVPSHERPGYKQEIYDNLFRNTRFLQYGIPGLIYCFDNNFQYVILQFLQPAELAILWNFKIFATALLLHTFLNRRYTQQQWMAMIMLVLGCAWTQGSDFLAQHSQAAHMLHPAPSMTGGSATASKDAEMQDELLSTAMPSKLVGVGLAVIGSSVAASGNVVCEWLVKKQSQESMHVQNMQLYCFGILFNLTTLILKVTSAPDSPIYGEDGFFTGYNHCVWAVIVVGSCSGIAVSVTLKFVDNIAVIFAHALSMIAVAVISAQFFGLRLSVGFVGGGTLVLVSLYLFYSEYGVADTKPYSNGNGEASALFGLLKSRSARRVPAAPMYCFEGSRI